MNTSNARASALRLLTAATIVAIALLASAAPPEPAARMRGLTLHVYEVEQMSRLQYLVDGQTPNVSRNIPTIDLRTVADFGGIKDRFLAEAFGYLQIDTAGEYEFRLSSDDGSELSIDGRPVIDNDGLHGAEDVKTAKVRLDAGPRELRVRMFEATFDQQLTLEWKPPGAATFEVIPTEAYFTEANVVHVTSPGPKKLLELVTSSRPGDGQPLNDVHPSFTATALHGPDFEPRVGGIDVFPDGRVAICTWDPQGDVYMIDPRTNTRTRFATGLAEPLGLTIVDGTIYVLQKQELTALVDGDNDGTADEYRAVASGWPVTANFHEFAFGLAYRDGYFYANLAVAIDPGGRTSTTQVAHDPKTGVGRGQMIRIDPRTGEVTSAAQGLRTPNGVGVMRSTGDIYLTDNQGDWLPSSKLLKLRDNAFYGAHTSPDHAWARRPVTPPVAWLPQGEIGNSPSQPAECTVGPWKGQILHGDVTHGGLKRTFVETIDGTVEQGCVFEFSQGFNGGVNRLISTDDGTLYVGQIGSTGNWGQTGKKRFGLQRLTYNGTPTFEMLAVRAKRNGFEIEFTQPLAPGLGTEPTHFFAEQWRYVPKADYGGRKYGQERLAVRSATVSDDRRRVFLEVEGARPGHVVHLRLADILRNEQSQPLWTTEGWYTLNAIPSGDAGEVKPTPPHNVLSDAERRDGWRLLFDGQTTAGWRGFRKQTMPASWKAVDGELRRVAGGGDIVTLDEFGDFELTLDWKIAPGGNSGVFWRAGEDEDPVWRTAVEMQVLDNKRHPDGRNPLTSAGSCYALIAPTRDVSLTPDRWNTARIVVRGTKFEHWLNNEKVVSFDMSGDEWKQLVAQSKFKDFPNFAKRARGRICLQDHGDEVSYRNIKIRELK